MSFSKDIFEVNTSSAITAHKSACKRFKSMRDLFRTYRKYLASYNGIITNTKQQPEEDILMIDRIHRKMDRIKQVKDMLLYYCKLGDLLYEYENINTFHTRKEIEDILEVFIDNPRHKDKKEDETQKQIC